jgi:translation initiation factor IF-2
MKRIHELAKEQDVESGAIIDVLKRAGLPESKCTPSSTISPEWEKRLMPLFDRLREAAKRQAAQAEAKAKKGARKRTSTRASTRVKKTGASTRTKAAARSTTKSKSTAKKKTTKKKTTKKKTATRSTTGSRSTTKKSGPKRWTAETVSAADPARSTTDAWDELEQYEQEKRKEKHERKAAPKADSERTEKKKQKESTQARPPTAAEIVAAAGIPVTHAAGRIPQLIAAQSDQERAHASEVGTLATPPVIKPAKKAKKKAARPRTKEREISESGKALAERLGSGSGSRGAKVAIRGGSIDEIGEDRKGASLLGDVPQLDEEIATAYGSVAEYETSEHEGAGHARKSGKAKTKPNVREGFERGRGFSLGPAQVGGGPAMRGGRGRGGRGKKFFRVTGGGAGAGRGRSRGRGRQRMQSTERPSQVDVAPPVTIKELSAAMGVRVPDIIRYLMGKGQMLRQNDIVDEELALEIGLEFNIEVNITKKKEEGEEMLARLAEEAAGDDPNDQVARAPVITILGHVDHGKTTLLDRIRSASVAEGEAGGITQHIGSYKVDLGDGRSVVFVDTPGHEAFTEMRARGANVTDVVVLVVAADDGVMPQTEEAYSHAAAAEVPVVVALNKIDKPDANAMRAKQQLSGLGLQPVEWGGDSEIIEVSALTGTGIDNLLETLWLQSEILELKANPKRAATGTCLEAKKTEGRGIVANLLVQNGTLQPGDIIVCGVGYGRVRAVFDDRGRSLDEAGPSTPVEVIGLEHLPEAGARFYVLPELSQAKDIAEQRMQRLRQKELAERRSKTPTRLEDVFAKLKAGETQEVLVVLKADVRGSLEVLKKELESLSTEEVRVRVLHSAVGGVNESDVLLADASDAIIIGFNVVPDDRAREEAELKGVDVRTYRVIYNVLEDVKLAMEGMLAPEAHEEIMGDVEVRATFKSSAIGTIAGCHVTKGRVERNAKVRLIRDGVIIYEGELSSLKRHKDDAKEVREGFECGITLKDYQDIHEGDKLQAYEIKLIARTLS